MGPTVNHHASADMAMMLNTDIVLNQRATVDDAMVADRGPGIHNDPMANGRTLPDTGVPAHDGMRRDDGRKRKARFRQACGQGSPRGSIAEVPKCQNCGIRFLAQAG